jgi:uncharacterized lipoprotein YmbA
LEPLAAAGKDEGRQTPDAPVLGVGPIRFPQYLDRPQVIVAKGQGQFTLREDVRWAEDLGANFSRVFAEDLAARLPSARVLTHPWPRNQDVSFKVTLRVNQFHLTDSGFAKLDTRWELYRKDGLLTTEHSLHSVRVESVSPGAEAMALSRTIDLLSAEVAVAVARFRLVLP